MDPMTAALIGSTAMNYFGAQSAAQSQKQASEEATAAQMNMFAIQNQQQKPYREAGYSALGQIQGMMPQWNKPFTADDFKNNMDPGYQFNLEQGQKGIQSSAAVGHGLVNAGTLASLSNYSQGMASNEYQNAFNRYQQQISNSYNRLASVAGLGQTATNASGAAAQNAGNNISSNIIGMGNAQAAGTVGMTNAITGGLGQAINYGQNQQWMNKMFPSGGGEGSMNPVGSSYNAGGQAGQMAYAMSLAN